MDLGHRGRSSPSPIRSRPGMAEAIGTVQGAGIHVLVVTGDHPATALAIAQEAGLETPRVVTGAEIEGWSDDRLATELGSVGVVARATPSQKLRIVQAAQRAGRTIAVTGDGVNDAPALHAADVAVAMGSGTAVRQGRLGPGARATTPSPPSASPSARGAGSSPTSRRASSSWSRPTWRCSASCSSRRWPGSRCRCCRSRSCGSSCSSTSRPRSPSSASPRSPMRCAADLGREPSPC